MSSQAAGLQSVQIDKPRSKIEVPPLTGKRVIPPALFAHILSFLETRQDGSSVARTCRAWRPLVPKCTLACLDSKLLQKIADQVVGVGVGIIFMDSMQKFTSSCFARFERVRAIHLNTVDLHYRFDQDRLLCALFQTYPTCASVAYPWLQEDFYILDERQPAELRAQQKARLEAIFGFLPGTVTTLSIAGIEMSPKTIFSHIRENSNITSLTLPPYAFSCRDADESVSQVQSIGRCLQGLQRLEIPVGFSTSIPSQIFANILQGLPKLPTLSIVSTLPGHLTFTHNEQVDARVIPQNQGLKRVEFTRCQIDSRVLQIFERSCSAPPQFSFIDCRFAENFTFTMQLLRSPNPNERR